MARTALLSLLTAGLVGTTLAATPMSPVAALDADTTAPHVQITSPVASPTAPVYVGDSLTADFSCDDPTVESADTAGVASCNGMVETVPDPSDLEPAMVDPTPVVDGQLLDTSLPGSYRLVVTGTDGAGNTASASVTYTVTGRPPADTTAPEITISSPVDGALVKASGTLLADYACQDTESGMAQCVGDVASGKPVDTATVGAHSLTVTSEDSAGNVAHKTVQYEVVAVETVILRGRMQDESGAGVTGGTVEAMLAGTNGIVARTTVGSDGRYSLALSAGTYDLRFRGPSGSGLGADLAGRELAGDTTLDVTLVPTVTRLLVHMYDGMGGDVADGNVTAWTSSMEYAGTWPVGSTGEVDLHLTAGDYYLTYNGASEGGGSFYGETDVMSLDSDQSVELRPATSTMTLTLRDADGVPVTAQGYYTCTAFRQAAGRRVLESVSRQNVVVAGTMDIPVLAVQSDDACDLHLQTTDGLAFTRQFDSGAASYEVDLARPVHVTGQLSDGAGGTFDRGQVSVSGGESGGFGTSTPIGSDGQFSFLLEPDTYQLAAGGASDKLDYFTVTRTVAATSDQVVNLDPAPQQVHLSVARSDGSQVSAPVEVTCSATSATQSATLRYVKNVNGQADLYGMTSSGTPPCEVWVRPPGEAQTHQQFDASAGSVSVVVPRTVHVHGTVGDGVGGTTRVPATIRAVGVGDVDAGSISSDDSGSYDLPVAEGNYRIVASGSSNKVSSYSVRTSPHTFSADEALNLTPKLLKLNIHLRGPDGSAVHGRADMSCATTDVPGLEFQDASSSTEFTGTGALWGMAGTGWDGGAACWLNIYPDGGTAVFRRVSFDAGTPKDLVVYTAGAVVLEDGVTAGQDNDNVSDIVEALGPNGGDGNADGIADYLQENVTSLPVSGGDSGQESYLTVAVPAGVTLGNVSTLPVDDPSVTSAPPVGVTLPEGLVQFRLDGLQRGSDQTVSLYPSSTSGLNGYAKYHDGAWTTLPEDRVHIVSGQGGPDRVDIRLTDGGVGDDDGVVDGSILDPGGLAVLQRDRVAPSLTVTGVTDGGSYRLGAAPAAGCTAVDENGGSGLAGACTLQVTGGNANRVGDFKVTATATDKAGNVATRVVRYRVEYRFDGFKQPINDPNVAPGSVMSVFQSGSTVPLLFRLLRADGSVVTPVVAPQQVEPERGAVFTGKVNASPTPPTGLPSGEGLWQLNWATRKVDGGYRYRIGVALDDGTTHYVTVGLR